MLVLDEKDELLNPPPLELALGVVPVGTQAEVVYGLAEGDRARPVLRENA